MEKEKHEYQILLFWRIDIFGLGDSGTTTNYFINSQVI